jgi:nucleotide-binding universal stress UspA family protein
MQSRARRRASPISRILAATDFSPGSEAALTRAARLPLAPDATLHVVHVLPGELPRKIRKQAEPEARRLLAKATEIASAAATRAGNPELEIVPVLVWGHAYVEVIRQARAHEVDLIAIGRHSRRPLRDVFLGSTAERVVRKGDRPVLMVNTNPSRPYRRPVVAVELSEVSRRIVDLALRLSDPGVGKCWLVHAYHVPFESWLDSPYYRKEWRKKAADEMSRLVAELGSTPGVRWRKVLRAGAPESVILGEVMRLGADLVALGTHARSGVGHALLGSVAAWVLRSAPCDVVIARPPRFTFELP